jgi:hypothetical protein
MPQPPGPRRDVVEIPRRVLMAAGVGLTALLVAGLLVVAYRAGHESARAGLQPAAPATVARPLATGSPTRLTASEAQPAATTGIASVDELPSAAPALANGAAPAAGATSPPPTTAQAADPAREVVARYLSEVETIEAQARYWSDPQALAQTLVDQGTRGEASGFDRLIETNRTALARLRSLSVPDACREHHAATIPLMEDAIALLERVKRGMTAGAASLEDLPAVAADLDRRGRQVDAAAAELKRRYRIP